MGLEPPTPWGTAADIAKMFGKKFSRKLDFGSKNTIFAIIRSDFCEIPLTISQKIGFRKKLFHDFRNFSATLQFLQKSYRNVIYHFGIGIKNCISGW
jgi:hypothetical protein